MTTTTLPTKHDPTPTITSSRARLALLALSVGGFGIGLTEFVIAGLLTEVADVGLTEFVIAGLLTEVADGLGVSITAAGHLVGGYALAVVPGALVITPFLMRRPPKVALALLLGFFIAGNALSAWAPSYEIMLTGRIVSPTRTGRRRIIRSPLPCERPLRKPAHRLYLRFGPP